MSAAKFDTGFQTIKVNDLTLSYTTQYGTTKVEGNVVQLITHLTSLIQ